ncbi:transposase [Sporosarcina newyorkensis 2681]|uniref:Transposase n=1 Tax=Sporosarcina newyorkensis 2681 TaxID=1027292 RepID=F9DY92_9BACL|nr:IS21 family transposase [Sporosarcina newyorkensis]EGQ18685.1 transposase [Sporosarcina newyorkensis 2681]
MESEEEEVEIWMVYFEVKRLRSEGFSDAAIARKLKISRNRVKDYGDKTPEEFHAFALSLQTRKKKLDPYEEQILEWLKEHPDLTSAQVADWLKEKLEVHSVSEGTVRNFVNGLREKYCIPKQLADREYAAVPELPMGKQMQVDFGETRQQTAEGKSKKLYFIGFVLAHSRYKYVEWLDRPFTTKDLIRMHENAFSYFGGMPEEMVYDQDSLLAISENAGDLILTAEFTKYHQKRKFKIYLCRKADPESKGKIERVVQYVKGNFAKNRVFDQLINWQESCMKWLKRTGNYNVHHTTKKRPVEVYTLEKEHLRPVSGTYIFENVYASSITRQIHKDNVIRFDGNRYSVPLGTFRPNAPNIAYIEKQHSKLFVRLQQTGPVIAEHSIARGKGKLISDASHRKRNQTKRTTLIQQVSEMIADPDVSGWLIDQLKERYPRHLLDQLKIIQAVGLQYPQFLRPAVCEMRRLQLNSAHDVRDIAISLEMEQKQQIESVIAVNEKYKDLTAPERKEDIYLQIFQGGEPS